MMGKIATQLLVFLPAFCFPVFQKNFASDSSLKAQ